MASNSELILNTERLRLRPLETTDVEHLWPHVSDPELPKLMSWDAHKDRSETIAFLKRMEREREEGKTITWGIFLKEDFCGLISLIGILRKHRALTYDRAELAYWMGKRWQGEGIMTEAGLAVIDFAFKKLGLHRLTAGHVAENHASERLIDNWNFRYIGEEKEAFSKHARWYKHKLYELLKKDYQSPESSATRDVAMREKTPYCCPETRAPLFLARNEAGQAAQLQSAEGVSYPLRNGLPDLTYPPQLDQADARAREFYDARAEEYDKYLHLTFRTHREDEQKVRNFTVELLELREGDRVLDVACGTGRDSEVIAQRLGRDGALFMQDLAPRMLQRCVRRLEPFKLQKEFCISNASRLPFADRYFDAAYSFGGLGEFADLRGALAEMVRVTKPGGKIVVGDESIPPWLRQTDFAKILITTNRQFEAAVPLEQLPLEAREVCLRWVIGGVFYLIDFRVGVGEPEADFDFEIPGPRGGTYRTRYEGQLEGVTREAKQLACKAVRKKDVSMHKWLDDVVLKAAREELRDG